MRNILLAALVTWVAAPSGARAVEWFENKAADDFIAKHFPNASLPGQFEGHYRVGRHRHWAACYVPAMGARSDGALSVCVSK